jgi:hypothetical protein
MADVIDFATRRAQRLAPRDACSPGDPAHQGSEIDRALDALDDWICGPVAMIAGRGPEALEALAAEILAIAADGRSDPEGWLELYRIVETIGTAIAREAFEARHAERQLSIDRGA